MANDLDWIDKCEKLYEALPFYFMWNKTEVCLADWVRHGPHEGYAARFSLTDDGKPVQEHLINSRDIERYIEHKVDDYDLCKTDEQRDVRRDPDQRPA